MAREATRSHRHPQHQGHRRPHNQPKPPTQLKSIQPMFHPQHTKAHHQPNHTKHHLHHIHTQLSKPTNQPSPNQSTKIRQTLPTSQRPIQTSRILYKTTLLPRRHQHKPHRSSKQPTNRSRQRSSTTNILRPKIRPRSQ